ncbi:MAG: gamma-glutamyl-gamma-aminobutyrate hydrolase family protein, partial [Eggerthellaceae bacterium]|nr:gamma-glutamyl-gamma-aminobutyrate hydrolase family protein [Eggerthellaceae bacterium]
TLYRDLLSCGITDFDHYQKPPFDEKAQQVLVEKGTVLSDSIGKSGPIKVNTMHHQAVHRIPKELHPVAWAFDGTTESIEDPTKRFFVGVQWHPEYLDDEASLFEALVDSARIRKAEAQKAS